MRLGDYVSVKTGKLDANAADENGEYPFFTCSVNSLRINRYDYDCECVLVAGNGDLNVKYYDGKFNAYQRTYIIESNDKNVLLVPYLYRFMEKYVERLRSDAIGGVIKYIKLSNITDADIHICTLDEQREKVDILDRVDALISKYQLKQTLMEEFVKSRFIEMFGDPMTNSMEWECVTLGDAVSVKPQNGLYKPQSDYVTNDSGTPILRIDAFYEGRVNNFADLKRLNCTDKEIQKYLLQEDDIVINRVNSLEYLGKCAHITGLLEDTVYESNMMRFHMKDEYNPIYTTHLLCSSYIKKQIMGCAKQAVNQASINQQDVQSFTILKPPIDLQNQFANFVTLTDKSKLSIQQSIETLQTLKAKLMQDYFG